VRSIVLDTSVAIAWLLPDEPLRVNALGLEVAIRTGELEPVVASNFDFELRHSLVRASRRGRLAWDRVTAILLDADASDFESPVIDYPLAELLDLCRTHRLSWSDAHHVWLARATGLPLVTADRRLVNSMAGSDVWMAYLGDRPADQGVP
jgi:predicted nucleic acid-binding protein